MTWNSVLPAIAKLAPTIASAVGGPLAGTAVSFIEKALNVNTGGDLSQRQDSVAAAIAGATPDQLLALKQADNDFAVKMAELGFKDAEALAALGVQDRDSARKREMGVKDFTPRILAYLIIGTAFGVAYGVLFHKMIADSVLAGTVVGYLFSEARSVTSYYFGSSQGSAEKSKLLAESQPAVK